MLQVTSLTKTFDGLIAVNDINLSVEAGMLYGVIGPNGSGKTTLFNILTGFLDPTAGQVVFNGIDLSGKNPESIVRAGIARTFQVVRFHKDSTVRETVWAAQSLHLSWFQMLKPLSAPSQRDLSEEVDNILERTWLRPHADRLARELPFGLVRQLEIARALATRPKLLLMDEPASGMNPTETHQLTNDIKRLRDSGITVLLIEHDIEMVMNLCDRIAVLNFGKKIAEGTADEVRADPDVIAAYLGEKYRAQA